MVDRYQLVLAAVALVAGVVVVAVDHWAQVRTRPDALTRTLTARTWALTGLVGALLGGWMSPRALPWWVAACLVGVFADRPASPHPMGRLTPLLCVVSLVGVWSAVPDTEPAVAMAGVMVPVAVARARRGPPPGPAGTAALVVGVVGAAWVGSAGRGAGLAAAAAVGMVLIAPLVLGWGEQPPGRGRAALVAAHVAVALVLPRAVMERPAGPAVAVALVVSGALAGVALLVRRADRGQPAGAGTSPG